MTHSVDIGLFTDPHYAPIQYMDRYCVDSLAKMADCVARFNTAEVGLMIGLGDLVDKADTKDDERRYLQQAGAVLADFRGERRLVLGNHDVTTLSKAEFLADCGIPGAEAYGSFDYCGLHVVILDSLCHEDGSDCDSGDFEWNHCWVSQAQLDWLAADLAAAGDRMTLVFCHVNLEDDGDESHRLENAAEVRAVLEAAGTVRAVFQGHYHPGRLATVNGIPYVTLRAMVTGPGLENTACAVVTVHPDGRIDLRGHGQQPSLSLPAPTP